MLSEDECTSSRLTHQGCWWKVQSHCECKAWTWLSGSGSHRYGIPPPTCEFHTRTTKHLLSQQFIHHNNIKDTQLDSEWHGDLTGSGFIHTTSNLRADNESLHIHHTWTSVCPIVCDVPSFLMGRWRQQQQQYKIINEAFRASFSISQESSNPYVKWVWSQSSHSSSHTRGICSALKEFLA